MPSAPLRDPLLHHVDPGIDLDHLLHLEGIVEDLPADVAQDWGFSVERSPASLSAPSWTLRFMVSKARSKIRPCCLRYSFLKVSS